MVKRAKDREGIINRMIKTIEKEFGAGAIMALGQGGQVPGVETVSSGSLSLDLALGIGGLPRGRLVEVYGPESSGKTTLALHAIAEVQREGGVCAFIDAEHALDVTYAQALGVSLGELLVSQPDCGEQALEIADHLVLSGAVDLVVVDSVAALVPRAEIEGQMGDHHLGAQARLMSQAMRKLTGAAHRSGTSVLFINQTRQKIGVTFGSNITTTGGTALKFYASVRLEVRRIGAVRDGDVMVGNKTLIKVMKNKVAPPFRKAECEILYGKGVNKEGEVLDHAVAAGLIKKSGAWYALGDARMGQGRVAACSWLAENPDQQAALTAKILGGQAAGQQVA